MAVVFLFRLAIQFAPEESAGGALLYRWVASGGNTPWEGAKLWAEGQLAGLFDPHTPPGDVEDALNNEGPEGAGPYSVTDWSGTFELRKLQWRLSRAPAGGTLEDVDVMTFHFLKTSGGAPAAWVDGTDLANIEGYVTTYYNAIKAAFPSWLHSDQYRWYKDGPAFYTLNGDGTAYVPIGDNPAIRITEVDVPGTGATGGVTAPQNSVTTTEVTSSRKHWGRWYLPATMANTCSNDGRLASATLTLLLNGAVAMYNSARAAGYTPVVWSIQKPVRPKKPSGTLPAQPALACEVTALQMDDLFDVIRSRRYAAPTIKTRTTLT